jgi:hypothetical protein
MFILPFLIGIVIALASIPVMHWCRVAYQRGTWAAAMIAISAFYIVFAFERGTGELEHITIASVFSLLALLGARFHTWFIVIALVGHGIFDVFVQFLLSNPSPAWWGPFCIGIDVIWGLWLAFLIAQKRI